MEKATFAAGCFWGVEAAFQNVEGVTSTRVGYTGGRTKDPTYKQVCTDTTGHAEAVELTFDPKKISYEELLDIFWNCHDPTTLNRQGPDTGTQYRSAIFYHNEKQNSTVMKSKTKQQKKHKSKIVTEITAASTFYEAEEYHQKYLEKSRRNAC